MSKRRNYYRYELKDGKKVVYRGITDNPDRRENEHNQTGKRFSQLNIIGPSVTKPTAEKWEEKSLESYRTSHKGKNPKYNKTNK